MNRERADRGRCLNGMTQRTERPARLRTDRDGELACAHRNRSVCPECFARTPGIIDVFGVVYRFHPTDWIGQTMTGLVLSPGTLTD